MILPDVNVLIYAFNSDLPEHPRYRPWLHSALEAGGDLGLADTVLTGFLRIVTNARVWSAPAATSAALDFVNVLVGAPSSRWLTGGDEVWRTLNGLVGGDRGVRGNVVPDAYLAALAIAHGASLATADRGFARFPGLRWFDPAESEPGTPGH